MKKEIEKEIVSAYCPYCLRDISIVWVCKLESVIGLRYVYFCGECQKSLGTFQNKVKNFGSLFTRPALNGGGIKTRPF